jgi:hypothetical protein
MCVGLLVYVTIEEIATVKAGWVESAMTAFCRLVVSAEE